MVKALIVLEDTYPIPVKEAPGTEKQVFVSHDGKKYVDKPQRGPRIGGHYTVEVHADDLGKPLIPIIKWIR